MLKFLPVGFIGLMVGGLIAANSSTILTHLNWGASYLVHDFYRRFIRRDADERTTLRAGRVGDGAAVPLLVRHGLPAGHGEGRVRHHPAGRRRHRPALSGALVLVARERVVRDRRDGQLVRDVGRAPRCWRSSGVGFSTHAALLITVAVTTVCWLLAAYLGAADRSRGADRRSTARCGRSGPGWAPIRAEAGTLRRRTRRRARTFPLALLGWVAGCMAIWSSLFAVGNYPLRPDGLRDRADDRVRDHRADRHPGGAHVVGGSGRELTGPVDTEGTEARRSFPQTTVARRRKGRRRAVERPGTQTGVSGGSGLRSGRWLHHRAKRGATRVIRRNATCIPASPGNPPCLRASVVILSRPSVSPVPSRTHFTIFAPASCATAASVVCAAFSPSRKSLSVNVANTSVGWCQCGSQPAADLRARARSRAR